MGKRCSSGACPGPWGCRLHACPCQCHVPKPSEKKVPGVVVQFPAPNPMTTAAKSSVLMDYYDRMLHDMLTRMLVFGEGVKTIKWEP